MIKSKYTITWATLAQSPILIFILMMTSSPSVHMDTIIRSYFIISRKQASLTYTEISGVNRPNIIFHMFIIISGELLGETPPRIPVNPPPSSLPLTNRTFVRSPNDAGTSEEQKAKHTSRSFADVASETLLLNKIKKKLDSVLVRYLYKLENNGFIYLIHIL